MSGEESAPNSFRGWALKYNALRDEFEENNKRKNSRIQELEQELEDCVAKVKSWKSEKLESLESQKDSLAEAREMIKSLGEENDKMREQNLELKKKLRAMGSDTYLTPGEAMQKRYEKARKNELDAKREMYDKEREVNYL